MKFKTLLQLVLITLSLLPLVIVVWVFQLTTQNTIPFHLLLLIAGLSISMSIIVSFFISKPLEKLVTRTESIQNGKREIESNEASWHEIQKISQQFNTMMAKNEDMNRTLNKRIMERTLELNKAIVDLREMSSRDPLTGLYNRRYLNERMAQELNRSNRYQSAMSVILFETQNLVTIKQDLGEDALNAAIVEISKCLQSFMRASDIVARVGNEKFCIVLTGEAATSAYELIEKLKALFATLKALNTSQSLKLECGFGIYNLDINKQSSDPLGFDVIYERADVALGEALQQGTNQLYSYVSKGDDNT